MIGDKVREMAEICDGRVIDLIASGYNIDILPYGWLALIAGLAGIEFTVDEKEPVAQKPGAYSSLTATEKVIEEVRKQLKEYWSCLR
jgi:acetoin utilization deacetylase AcuC-like enzyme